MERRPGARFGGEEGNRAKSPVSRFLGVIAKENILRQVRSVYWLAALQLGTPRRTCFVQQMRSQLLGKPCPFCLPA